MVMVGLIATFREIPSYLYLVSSNYMLVEGPPAAIKSSVMLFIFNFNFIYIFRISMKLIQFDYIQFQ